jgi:hypothetical protein
MAPTTVRATLAIVIAIIANPEAAEHMDAAFSPASTARQTSGERAKC